FARKREEPVRSVVFAPDGKALLTGSGNFLWTLWDAATGKERATFQGHSETPKAAFTSDGKTFFTHTPSSITVRDADTGQIRATFPPGAGSWITDAAFAPDGKSLAIAVGFPFDPLLNGSVNLHDVGTRIRRWTRSVPGGAFQLGFTAQGDTLAV